MPIEHTGSVATAAQLPPALLGAKKPFAARGVVPGRVQSEKSDAYSEVVAILNPALRVICGDCGLQWIVQKKVSPTEWKGFAYCATKEGLLLRLPKNGCGCDPGAWCSIAALPDYFPKRANAQRNAAA